MHRKEEKEDQERVGKMVPEELWKRKPYIKVIGSMDN